MATKRKASEVGGMFTEFEPVIAPTAATTPMFEVPAGAVVTVAVDYGQAVAPTREVRTPGLFDLALKLPAEDGDGGFQFGLG